MQQADGIACHQPAQRVADDADARNVAAPGLDVGQHLFDLGADALAARLDAVVRKGPAVALGHQEIQPIFRVFGAQSVCNGGHVARVSPKL